MRYLKKITGFTMPVSLHDFCFILSLQAGVVITSIIGFTVMVITFFFNLYAPNSMSDVHQISQYGTLYLYLLVMMVAFGMAFMAAFWELSKFIRIAAIILGVGTFFYAILSIASFIRHADLMLFVCPEMRCPDHHWLQDARWRKLYVSKWDTNNTKMQEENNWNLKQNLEKFLSQIKHLDSKKFEYGISKENSPSKDGNYLKSLQENIASPITENEDKDKPKPKKDKKRDGDILLLMFISFLYSVCVIAFYLYSILTMVTYAKQLDKQEYMEGLD